MFCFSIGWNRSFVTLILTVLTSSQSILIVWSKRAGKYEYSVTTANFLVSEMTQITRVILLLFECCFELIVISNGSIVTFCCEIEFKVLCNR